MPYHDEDIQKLRDLGIKDVNLDFVEGDINGLDQALRDCDVNHVLRHYHQAQTALANLLAPFGVLSHREEAELILALSGKVHEKAITGIKSCHCKDLR